MGLVTEKNHIEYPIMSLKELRYKFKDLYEFMRTWRNYKIIDIIDNEVIDKAYRNAAMIESLQMALNSDNITSNRGGRLALSGIMDSDTSEAINKMSKSKFIESRYYSTVKWCQKLLKFNGFEISVTGNYNRETRQAIIDMKNRYDVMGNGVIDKTLIILLIGNL